MGDAKAQERGGDFHVLKFDALASVERGGGVTTTQLVGKALGASGLTTGITRFPPGTAIPLHHHNCPEQVTILEGEAEVEIDGHRQRLVRLDTTFVSAGKPHRFRNVGQGPMAILWIYGSSEVTRTFSESGVTVAHLSPQDAAAVPAGNGA